MRLISYRKNGGLGLALRRGQDILSIEGLDLLTALQAGAEGLAKAAALAQKGKLLDPSGIEYLPVIPDPPKIVCVGMNYQDHADENKLKKQEFPTFFARFTRTLIGHKQPILRPWISDTLDYEGEMAVIIGKPGRHIPVEKALDHVAG